MPSPFPGMDPYLETPLLWRDVHHGLISQIQAALNPKLRPHYVARVELRVYVSDEDDPGREAIIPDVRVESAPRRKKGKRLKATVSLAEPLIVPLLLDNEIEEARVEIRHVESDSLVTVIEVLSPTNKIKGSRGRFSFMEKRQEIIAGPVHWVEIDLLCKGEPSVTRPPLVRSDYRVLISRAGERSHARYWPLSVRQPLPSIGIPLRGKDADVALDLSTVFRETYDHGAYDISIDYRKEPDPPLAEEDRGWADELLRARKLRR
jgi:hypothetical protein